MQREYKLLIAGLILGMCLCGLTLEAQATNRKDYLDSLNVGVSQIGDPTGTAANEEVIRELTELSQANGGQKETDLVMANVQVAMNVREEADGESEKVGLLYKDCGASSPTANTMCPWPISPICTSAPWWSTASPRRTP